MDNLEAAFGVRALRGERRDGDERAGQVELPGDRLLERIDVERVDPVPRRGEPARKRGRQRRIADRQPRREIGGQPVWCAQQRDIVEIR